MSEHAQMRELLPLYALGALEGTSECELVCAHLATGCPDCAAELAEHARAASALPAALAPVAPRPQLREAIAKRIAATPQDATVVSGSNVVSLASRRRPTAWVPAVIAASVAALAIFAAYDRHDQLRRERVLYYRDAKTIADSTAEIARLRQEISKDEATFLELASGDAVVFPLKAQKDQTGAGHVIWNRKARTWTLIASGMKPLDAGQIYELWFIEAGKDPVAAVKFVPDERGLVRQTVHIPPTMQKIDVAAVTLEPRPDPDPEKPSATIVIAGNVAS